MKIGITFSAFDLLHAGHIKMLEDAKRQCDYLIVALQTDPTIDRPKKNKPTQSVVERYIQLKGCVHVDEIVPYATEQDLEDVLRSFKIDVRIIGDEYKDKNFTGRGYCEEKGITLYFNSRDHRFSSSSLRREVSEKENKKNLLKLKLSIVKKKVVLVFRAYDDQRIKHGKQTFNHTCHSHRRGRKSTMALVTEKSA